MHPTLGRLLDTVADEADWLPAIRGYCASFGAEVLNWFHTPGGIEQLAQADFTGQPEVRPPHGAAPELLATGITPQVTRDYMAHYHWQDFMWQEAIARQALPAPGAWVIADPPPGQAHRLRHAEFHGGFLRASGIGMRLFGGMADAAGQVMVSIYRPWGAEAFTREEITRFQQEHGVVRRAVLLRREIAALRARTRGLEALMERVPVGLLFFDSTGRLLHANARARALCARPSHGALLSGSVLASGADAALRALFQRSLQGHSDCAELPGGLLLVALAIGDLAPLGLGHRAPGVAWMVMERRLDSAAAVALARQAWRLSPSETALLSALMQGQTPPDFAAARGVRISTVRTLMSRLLDKTRTQRQQDLVGLVARLMLLTPAQTGAAADDS